MIMKQFGKFIGKCILVALPFILVIAYTLACPMGYMDIEYPKRAYTHDVINGDISYDTLVLGDSRAVADIVPNKMNDAVILANGGATAIENYYYLKDYIDKHGAPDKCIIGFAHFHYSQIDNFWNRTVYFNDLSAGELAEVFREARSIRKSSADDLTGAVLSGGDTADLISNRLRLPHVYMPALVNSRFVGRYSENSQIYGNICEAGGHQLYGTSEGSSDLNYEVNYLAIDENDDSRLIQLYLLKLMDMCEEYGIDTYVVSLPMNDASYNALHEEYVKSVSLFLKSLSDMYPAATVEQEIVRYDDELFGDSSHLNERGAEAYTDELVGRYFTD